MYSIEEVSQLFNIFNNKPERDQGNDYHVTQISQIAATLCNDLNEINSVDMPFLLGSVNQIDIIRGYMIQRGIKEYTLLKLDSGKTPVLYLDKFNIVSIKLTIEE